MNPSTIPATCSLALTAVVAAGISHWWSVRQFTGLLEQGLPAAPAPAILPESDPALLAAKPRPNQAQPQTAAASGGKGQNAFFEALVEKMNRVEAQNRDLLDQLAETNRDMMRMQFRLDTHSESFRPLPLVEDKPFSSVSPGISVDGNPGVLPPRAEQVGLPSYE